MPFPIMLYTILFTLIPPSGKSTITPKEDLKLLIFSTYLPTQEAGLGFTSLWTYDSNSNEEVNKLRG